jgi:hypothetical protein
MLAVALGVAAVEAGYTVRFARLDEWAQEAEAAEEPPSCLTSFWTGSVPSLSSSTRSLT